MYLVVLANAGTQRLLVQDTGFRRSPE